MKPSQRQFYSISIWLPVIFILSTATAWADDSASQGDKENARQPYWEEFSLKPAVDTYLVSGDKGRFRQDQLLPDGTSGGIEEMYLRGNKNDVSYEYKGRDLVNYDYLSDLTIKKPDDFSAKVTWKRWRKFWEGSTTPWIPSNYALPDDFKDFRDHRLYTDRGNLDVELSKHLNDAADLILEYHLWQRQGHESLLSSGFAKTATGLPDLGAIPTRNRVDGISHTFVIRMPFVVNNIHHIEPSFSAEIYHDSQVRENRSYGGGGIDGVPDDDYSNFQDSNEFVDLKSKLTYESWLKDNVHVNAGFENDILKNHSVRSVINITDPIFIVNPHTDNWRVSNAVSLGATLLDFLRAKQLDFRIGTHAEHALTDARSFASVDGQNRTNDSRINEGWFGELASLTYKGIPKTTAFASLDMEQRHMTLEETFDAQSMELFDPAAFGILSQPFPHDRTGITYINFLPTFRLVHRFCSRAKATVSYRFKSRFIGYDPRENNAPGFFEYMGDRTEYVNEIGTKLDVRLYKAWASTFGYQIRSDNRNSDLAGKTTTQDLDQQQFSAILSGPVLERLFLILNSTYEYNRLHTPTFGDGSNNWGRGTKPFNFMGDVYILAANANYRFTKKVNSTLGYQITSSLGNNKNLLNKVTAGLEYDISPTSSLEAKYAFMDFQDKRAANGINGGFNNYQAHGISFAFKKTFA